jgi:hypothetical protein
MRWGDRSGRQLHEWCRNASEKAIVLKQGRWETFLLAVQNQVGCLALQPPEALPNGPPQSIALQPIGRPSHLRRETWQVVLCGPWVEGMPALPTAPSRSPPTAPDAIVPAALSRSKESESQAPDAGWGSVDPKMRSGAVVPWESAKTSIAQDSPCRRLRNLSVAPVRSPENSRRKHRRHLGVDPLDGLIERLPTHWIFRSGTNAWRWRPRTHRPPPRLYSGSNGPAVPATVRRTR